MKLPAGATWEQLAQMSPDEIRERGALAAGLPAAAAPEPAPKAAWCFPQFHINEIKKQEGPRPHALRPRLRPAGPLPARVSAGDLPDHAAGSGRRLAGQAGHDRRTSTSSSTASSTPSSSKACGCWSRRSRSSNSTRPTTAGRDRPSLGVTCFDCHANGHTNARDPPGRRHPAAGVPPSHRHAVACAA